MKKQSILVIFMLFISMVTNAQTIIDISIEQNPPLKVVAENVTLNIPPSGLNIGSDITVEGGDGNFSYIWTDSNGRILDTKKSLFITAAGDYYLQVTDGNDCKVSTRFSATVTNGIDVLNSDKAVSQLRIMDTAGILVKKIIQPALTSASNYGLQPGIYLFTYIYSDGTATVKRTFIK